MTEPHPTAKVARDLTEIVDLHERLAAQAEHQASHSLMPGGHAMVALAGVANLEAWENMNDATERYAKAYTSAEDEDPDEAWSPFQILEFWSEQWRRELDAEYDQRPTISSEANFIRHCLDWAWDHELAWDDFVRDIRRARVRLEDILHAGNRVETSRIVCDQCEAQAKLIVLRGAADDGSEDQWKCSYCKERFDRKGMLRAHAAQLRQESAAKYLRQDEAIATLVMQGRNERMVRRWLEPPLQHKADKCTECSRRWPPGEYAACPGVREGEECGGDLMPLLDGDAEDVVGGFCDIRTRKAYVWWPDLWLRHCQTKTRGKASA